MNNNSLFEHYVLSWQYGQHHEPIETTEECFMRVLDSMANEFEITRSETFKAVKEPNKDYTHIFEVTYTFVNYWGDTEVLGICTKPQ